MKRFSCPDVVERVTAFLDHALDDDACRLFDDHLTVCPDCRDHLARTRATISALDALPRVSTPEENLPARSRDRLLAAFRHARDPRRSTGS